MVLSLDGMFVARVLNNKDPMARERLFVRVFGVHGTEDFDDAEYGLWAEHMAASLYKSGDVPPIGAEVYVQFLKGTDNVFDPMKAIWLGVVKKSIN